jgi:hypothetical protein
MERAGLQTIVVLGVYLNPLPRATARVHALAVATMACACSPTLLVGVEGYRDRLAALTQPTSGDPALEA